MLLVSDASSTPSFLHEPKANTKRVQMKISGLSCFIIFVIFNYLMLGIKLKDLKGGNVCRQRKLTVCL